MKDLNGNDSGRTRKRDRVLKHIAVVPVLITLGNALCGFASIHFAARGMQEGQKALLLQKPELTFFAASAWMIFLAMVADAFDGFVARKAGTCSDFGGQLDSLSDVISFGVAPAFLMLRIMEAGLSAGVSPIFGTTLGKLLWMIAAIYVSCTVLRLARFNVENEPDESAHQRFKGLPSPAAAAGVAAMVLLYSDILHEFRNDLPQLMLTVGSKVVLYGLPVMALSGALLMVSDISYPHVVNQYLKGRKTFEYVVIVVLLLLALVFQLQLVLALGSVAFAFSGLFRWAWKKMRNKKTPLPCSSEEKAD